MIESCVAIIPEFRLFASNFATWTFCHTVEPGQHIQGAQPANVKEKHQQACGWAPVLTLRLSHCESCCLVSGFRQNSHHWWWSLTWALGHWGLLTEILTDPTRSCLSSGVRKLNQWSSNPNNWSDIKLIRIEALWSRNKAIQKISSDTQPFVVALQRVEECCSSAEYSTMPRYCR